MTATEALRTVRQRIRSVPDEQLEAEIVTHGVTLAHTTYELLVAVLVPSSSATTSSPTPQADPRSWRTSSGCAVLTTEPRRCEQRRGPRSCDRGPRARAGEENRTPVFSLGS